MKLESSKNGNKSLQKWDFYNYTELINYLMGTLSLIQS